jgi:soluble lytic murein transglycosylase
VRAPPNMALRLVALCCVCLAPLIGSDASHAYAETDLGQVVTSAAASVTAADDVPAAKLFDPSSVRLQPESPEVRAVQALARGDRAQALSLAQALMPVALDPTLGRMRWLFAKATTDREAADAALRALAQTQHPLARTAQALLAAREAKASPTAAPATAPAGPSDSFALADALLASRRPDKAYAELARRFAKDASLACRARMGRARALIGNKASVPAGVDVLKAITKDCQDRDTLAWAHFYAGRSLLRSGDPAGSLLHYDALARDVPEHRLADDALLAGALAALDTGDMPGAVSRLRALCDQHLAGDMRPEARFQLAWLARREGRLNDALTELRNALDEGPGEKSEDLFGRAEYWHARTLLDLGKAMDAKLAFAELVRKQPLSYYAQQALMRLRELDPALATAMRLDLGSVTTDDKLLFAWRTELETPALATALELLRVGEVARAQKELESVGFFAEAADDELYFLGTAILHEAGAHAEAATRSRKRAYSIMTRMPVGRSRGVWRIAFPAAYRPLIEEVAKEANVPASFVRAVAREESSFDPGAVSSADAYGLIQVIEPTARAQAKLLGLPSDTAALKTPEVNLRIGAGFMRTLFSRYVQNPALVPAAYNAGPNAADRWVRERPTQTLDEWVENIPYSETRRYTRRVLQSYGVYAFLDEGQLPELAAKLPVTAPIAGNASAMSATVPMSAPMSVPTLGPAATTPAATTSAASVVE